MEKLGDQVLAQECYQAMLASKDNNTWMIKEMQTELIEALEAIELVEGDNKNVLNWEPSFNH